MPRLLLACAMMAVILAGHTPPVFAGDGSWTWPVDGLGGRPPTLAGEFDAPHSDYGPGHRGIDLATVVGAPVHAVAGGVLTFAGRVAGVDVITVDHGAERSTYQPAAATVAVGDRVKAGDVIGIVVVGPFHCVSPCLHLGRIAQADDQYLDPLGRLAGHTNILLVDPHGPPPIPPPGATAP